MTDVRSAHTQYGIALPTALVLLMVLALLATGALDAARLDLQGAHSLGEHRRAFELAEAANVAALAALADPPADVPACGSGPGLPLLNQAGEAGSGRAWLCFAGSTAALAPGLSLARLTMWHYEILAEGRSGRGHSLHRQGAWITGPTLDSPP